jgi:hypothetical protein
VEGANSASEDGQPNVRRDGLELFFFSNRPGTLGAADIYAANAGEESRPVVDAVRSRSGREQRGGRDPSIAVLGRDNAVLRIDSARCRGSTDHYVTTGEKVKKKD